MRRLRNGGDVGADNAEKRGTTAGRVDRAAPRDQAQGQAQAQAVAAGTSSRLSLLMLYGRDSCRVRGPPGETAKPLCFSVFVTYIYCVNQSVVLVLSSEVVRLNAVKPV